jgi:hypothetical protein
LFVTFPVNEEGGAVVGEMLVSASHWAVVIPEKEMK